MSQQKYAQAKYWILTVPHHAFVPWLPPSIVWIRGQLERGGNTDYLHWQFIVAFDKKRRLRHVKSVFGEYHAEPTRSSAAVEYVWKQDTRVEGTQFELGTRPMDRSSPKDWDAIRDSAISGQLETIPSDIYVRYYNSLSRIAKDNLRPLGIPKTVRVYWGPTGVGKSRRAWDEATLEAYPKDPRTKFWDGYRAHTHVVMDEFRGDIDIAHLLRWFDRYPVIVENKGSSTVLVATDIWITSNLSPHQWYPSIDAATLDALLRRLEITEMN